MDPQLSLSGDGTPLGMAVTLADRQHSGNDHRRMILRKIRLSFGAIISATFRNRGNSPKGSTYQDRDADAGGQKFGRPKN